ncbi:hypothetical protein COCON_G00074120 [Conger conger]|uniref:Selenoprotein W n=1 Tax=Conger conger TaxID=82655 RepID=A0A9Q1I215_CONCO|nr:hypothetical protein COCON_G00074120 [Conger conger]
MLLLRSELGFGGKFTRFKEQLLKKFPNDLEITGATTPTRSSEFEVAVNGVLVHSKKGGDGFVDNDDKMAVIFKAIMEALKK